MSALQFCVDTLRSGSIAGIGLDAQPDAWEAQLGREYIDDIRKGRMRRDFGLVEVSFVREANSWQCTEISIQVHRLASGEPDVAPNHLIEKYGRFEERIPFSLLEERTSSQGICLHRIDDGRQELHSRYAVTESACIVHALTAETGGAGSGRTTAGDVWSISLARDFDRRRLPIR
ncbi:hypothetical protein ACFWG6_03725 [Streptomyces erythrochromogenes]|uniref:hypothetical protein n=1 Tax=Streptomyces erythrochromogenes TaxID=285574 RepID=UPI0036336CDB